MLDNLKYLILSKRTKEECDLDVVNIIYFYSSNYCPTCPDQGVILTYFKKIFGDKLLIFPIDVDYAEKEPMVSILLNQYGVSKYPSLIIEADKHSGLVSNVKLKKIICDSFKNEKEICGQV